MWVFWDSVIEPLLGVTRPRRIVEIGVEAGATTRRLISWARDHEATVDGIDPAPSLDIEQWPAALTRSRGSCRRTSP
jgi:hypothetical protein